MPYIEINGINISSLDFLNMNIFNVIASALYTEYNSVNIFNSDNMRNSISIISAQGESFNFKHFLSRIFIDGYIIQIIQVSDVKYELVLFDNSKVEIVYLPYEFTKNEINSLCQTYSNVYLQNDKLKEAVLKQLSYINTMILFNFSKTNDQNRNNYIISKIKYLASTTSSLILFSDKKIYTIDDKLVFSLDGFSDFYEFHPIVSKDFVIKNAIMLDDIDKKRIEKNINFLKKINFPYDENFTDIPICSNTFLSNKDILFENLIINYSFATIATTLNGKKNEEVFDLIYNKLNSLYNIDKLLLPNEKKDMQDLRDGKYEKWVSLTWLYEYVAIFGWILGLTDFPNQDNQCDVTKMNNLFFFIDNIDSLKNKISIKDYEEVLQKADLLFRYQWAIDEAKIKHISLKSNIDKMIVHYQVEAFKVALNFGKSKNDNNNFTKKNEDNIKNNNYSIKEMIIKLNESQGKDKNIEKMLVQKVINEGQFFTIISQIAEEIKTITYRNGSRRIPIYTDMTELKKDNTISNDQSTKISTLEEIFDIVNSNSGIDGIVINPYSMDSNCTLVLTTNNIRNILNFVKEKKV